MSGGPISPSSFYPGTSGNIFRAFITGGGGNAAATEEGIGVVASLGADSTCQLRFPVPPGSVPTGTLKLRLLLLSLDATAGHLAKLTVQDATVAAGASPSAATLTSEAQTTFTAPATPAGKYVEQKVALTAAPAASDMLVVAITFNTTGWTYSSTVLIIPTIIWE